MQETLASGAVFRKEAGDVGVLHGTRVNDYAIAVVQRGAGFNGHRAVLRFVSGEDGEAPRVGGEEAIGARVPAHRVARIFGMIEDGNADLFTVDLARIIAPRRGLAPELLFA